MEDAEFLEYAGGDKEFAAFMKKVDSMVVAKIELGVYDLPDYAWRDLYDSNPDDKTLDDAIEDWLFEEGIYVRNEK